MVRSILIVDDSPTVRQALCELFTREKDFAVCGEAANGQEAIERAQQLHPDFIVTDLSMPIMSGLEEARILKQLMPTVPVIIYTAHSTAHAAGAYAVVSKSDPVATLIAAARSISYQIAGA
jgi:DNA-binding NarL/FixJ family response regulator